LLDLLDLDEDVIQLVSMVRDDLPLGLVFLFIVEQLHCVLDRFANNMGVSMDKELTQSCLTNQEHVVQNGRGKHL